MPIFLSNGNFLTEFDYEKIKSDEILNVKIHQK
jgi:hypothetical protein